MQHDYNGADIAVRSPEGVTEIVHRWEQTTPQLSVKFKQLSKGYGWDIDYAGTDPRQVLNVIHQVHAELKAAYPNDD